MECEISYSKPLICEDEIIALYGLTILVGFATTSVIVCVIFILTSYTL